MVVDPDLVALDPGFVAAQVGQGRRLADRALVHGERGLVPGAHQQAAAHHAFIEWRAFVGAVALVGVHLVALADEDDLFAAGLDTQGAMFVELGQAGHGVLGHGGSPKGPLEPFDAWAGEGMR
ncbi:hypothetical protein D3C77_628770 [compost metagenome]